MTVGARVREGARTLAPGSFSLVMAGGIISVGMGLLGREVLSLLLLSVSLAALVVLLVLTGWRLIWFRGRMAADFHDPTQAFAFFTLVAGVAVVAVRLVLLGAERWGLALLVVAGVLWLLLCYLVPGVTVLVSGGRSPVATANGSWFVWVVASQSVAVLAASLAGVGSAPLRALTLAAVLAWSVGVFLYAAEAIFVALREMLYEFSPRDFTSSYWVAMGAASITVVAGMRLARLHGPLVDAAHALLVGLSVMFWSFATWLVPILLVGLWWSHVRHRVPVRYHVDGWSMVFPVGMYGVACLELGRGTGAAVVSGLGRGEEWFALAVWVVTFAAMAVHLARTLRVSGPPGPGTGR